jgi:histone acetyltransferase (RNA polymerase elongator complex component)
MNRIGEILLNYVAPENIHQGIGRLLINKIEDFARNQGLSAITVMSTITAKTFYEKNGFVKNGDPVYIGKLASEFPLIKRFDYL